MNVFALISDEVGNPEYQVGVWATVGLLGAGLWLLLRSFRGPKSPDPWDESVNVEMENQDATPLCHRCLTPHDLSVNFCRECGAPVGEYTNLLPFPYLFSIGHTLRLGTSGEFRRSSLTIIGFFVLGLAEYVIFAPIYWIIFLLNLRKPHSEDPVPDPPAPTA